MFMLTARKQAFINVYKSTKNASESAKLAGYSAKTCVQIGSRLLRDVDVKTALESWEAEEKSKLTKENYVNRAWNEFESLDKTEANAPRFMEIAGKALGYIGNSNDSRPNQTLIINMEASASAIPTERWQNIRKLLDA